MSIEIEICKLKAGSKITAAGPGFIESEHPEDGWQRIDYWPDPLEPDGIGIRITKTPRGISEITAGHAGTC